MRHSWQGQLRQLRQVQLQLWLHRRLELPGEGRRSAWHWRRPSWRRCVSAASQVLLMCWLVLQFLLCVQGEPDQRRPRR